MGKNKWEQGVPAAPGYYWVYQNDDCLPVIFEIDDENIYQMGCHGDVLINYSVDPDVLAKYFWLPIEIPKIPNYFKS